MINERQLHEVINKYQLSLTREKKNHILKYSEVTEINLILDYLINELKIDRKNIEKCPSILYLKIELKNLLGKKIIDRKYSSKIISFKNKEALYLEAKENKYMDEEKARLEFQEKKKELYSLPEVSEYFKLERKINEMIEKDLNEIKASISNKLLETKSINSI